MLQEVRDGEKAALRVLTVFVERVLLSNSWELVVRRGWVATNLQNSVTQLSQKDFCLTLHICHGLVGWEGLENTVKEMEAL